jgi:methylmalonyl-CoA/ethylmalonyl-CoA epimerase
MFEFVHHVAYAVDDMDGAIEIFRDVFELELLDRRVAAGTPSFEMATFRCGQTIVELQRPIDYPELTEFIKEHGPGLTHVAFAVRDLPQRAAELEKKGVSLDRRGVFTAGTGWQIANFDTDRSGLEIFASKYHDDHLANLS